MPPCPCVQFTRGEGIHEAIARRVPPRDGGVSSQDRQYCPFLIDFLPLGVGTCLLAPALVTVGWCVAASGCLFMACAGPSTEAIQPLPSICMLTAETCLV